MRKFQITVFMALVAAAPAYAASIGGPGTYLGSGSDIMMEGFTWSSVTPTPSSPAYWTYLQNQLTTVASANVTMLWLPPSAASVDYEGYLPNDWYNQGNKYGSYAQLKALLAATKADNIVPLADIVIQHRSGDTGALSGFIRPAWADICSSFTCQSFATFGYSCASCTNETGIENTSAANLNMVNPQIQTDCENYMNWMLTSMGYSAFRMDESTGYGGSYVGQYLAAAPPYFAVSEYLDGSLSDCQNYLANEGGTDALYDFPLMYVMNGCVSSENYSAMNSGGRLPGLVGQSPKNSVTFLSDQDTAPPGTLSGYAGTAWPSGKELEGYAIILMAPGVPDIFYGHYFGTIPIATSAGAMPTPAQIAQEQSLINALTQIRVSMGINSNSTINIRDAANQLYAAVIDNRVCVKVGSAAWSPASDAFATSLGTWTLATFGCCNNNYAVWTLNGAAAPTPTPSASPTPACHNVVARIACGRSTPYTDSAGNLWSADFGCLSGTAAGGAAVSGTLDPILYETSRYGSPVIYSIGVPNGNYEVKFFLSETFWSSEGNRVFNVELNGVTAGAGIDPFAIGGANAAVVVTLTTSVSGGNLLISAAGIQDLPSANASINAIQISQLDAGPCWTFSPTGTPTPSQSPSASPTATASASPSPSPSTTSSATATASPTPSPSATASSSPSATRTSTLSPTPSASPSISPSWTASPPYSATDTRTITVTSTASPTPSVTPTQTPSDTPSMSSTASPSATPSPSSTVTLTQSVTASATLTPTQSPSPTASPTASPSSTPSPSSTASASQTPSATMSASMTVSPTFSDSPTQSPSPSVTVTASSSPSATSTSSATPFLSSTASPTASASATASRTFTASPTVTPSVTPGAASVSPPLAPQGGPLVIDKALAVPNPSPLGPTVFKVEVEGPVDRLTLQLYTTGMTCVGSFSSGGDMVSQWQAIPVQESAYAGLENGTYYFVVAAWRGAMVSKSVTGKFTILR